jgi:RNA polymerase sigma factor (sigma-70 family)
MDSIALGKLGSFRRPPYQAMAEPRKGLVESLFAEHRRALQTFFYRRIRTKSDAPDLAQEVYVRMLRVNDIDAIRNPERYLYTVASNLVKEYAVLDRWQARGVNLDETSIQDEASIQQRLGELPTIDGQLDVAQRVARLRTVLAQLSPKCRAAVVLQYRHGLSYQEIGERLNVSPHMVKKYLAQGLAHCRRRMARME